MAEAILTLQTPAALLEASRFEQRGVLRRRPLFTARRRQHQNVEELARVRDISLGQHHLHERSTTECI